MVVKFAVLVLFLVLVGTGTIGIVWLWVNFIHHMDYSLALTVGLVFFPLVLVGAIIGDVTGKMCCYIVNAKY